MSDELERVAIKIYGSRKETVLSRLKSETLRYREERKSWAPLLDVKITANGIRYHSLLEFVAQTKLIKIGEITFHNPRKFGDWGFVTPIKRVRFLGTGQGYAFLTDRELDFKKWAIDTPKSYEALVRVYPTRWVLLRDVKEMAAEEEEADISLWSVSTLLQEIRKQRMLPLEVRLVLLTKKGCFAYTINVVDGVLLDDPRNGKIPYTKKKVRNLQEHLLFERTLAESKLPDKLRIVFMACFDLGCIGVPEVMHLLNTSPKNAENILTALKSRGLVEEMEGAHGKIYCISEKNLRQCHSCS